MISIDTNILLYAQNNDCPENEQAFEFVSSCGKREDVTLCELVLVELHVLLRNLAVLQRPLAADQAVSVCQAYRQNPSWHLIENAPVMDQVWALTAQPNFP